MLSIEECAVVVVDIQGKLAELVYEKDRLVRNVAILLNAAEILDIPVIATEQVPQSLGPTVEPVKQNLGQRQPLAKSSFSCAGDAGFNDRLVSLGRRQVLLAGIESHICIYQTAVELCRAGYQVHVAADAVSSRDPENKKIALQRMLAEGVTVSCVEMALFELMRTAEHPHFREVSRLIR